MLTRWDFELWIKFQYELKSNDVSGTFSDELSEVWFWYDNRWFNYESKSGAKAFADCIVGSMFACF